MGRSESPRSFSKLALLSSSNAQCLVVCFGDIIRYL